MSTIGHVFVGAAASRYATPSGSGARGVAAWALITGAAILPDIDLVLPAIGVPDSLTLGHRGATHSLIFALIIAAGITLVLAAAQLPVRRIAIAATAAIGSHALLDTLTRGPGVAWLWPFSSVRLPTLPILPIAPVDDLLTRHGLLLLAAEALVFAPFLAYALLWRSTSGGDRSSRPAA
jgi:inner membrane protein